MSSRDFELKKGVDNMYSCCAEHVELAIDQIVDEYEVAPVVEMISEENQLSTTCSFCENEAIYIVNK
ncbi:CxxH/CxxC protein [Anaerobacillus sp. MEB173]|uniref:CxxH/CxxC protein n=1 Tax=Anaerobacillus sp. MEB173 TaxID=3383345 RepID=UPI003F8EAF98